MEQKLEIIKDLARKIMTNSLTIFSFDVDCNESVVLVRFFDIKGYEILRMQGKYIEVIAICKFMVRTKRKRI